MNLYFSYILFLLTAVCFSQNDQLAQNYFDRGEFDKAILMYSDLVKTNPNNYNYFQKEIACFQQLKQFENAEKSIKTRIERTKQPNLYVELGYNYQLQKETDKAQKLYQLALDKIVENPNFVYGIARDFEIKSLLQQAVEAYNLGMKGNPNTNFDYQIALLQGQLGKTDLMIESLVDYSFKYPENLALVQSQLTRFLNEDSSKTFSENLKKTLLVRTQKNQDIFWNQYMSWFFIQQKEYAKAFIQEKAIFKRSPDNMYSIVNLAKLTIAENENETATSIFDFILLNTQDLDLQLVAHYNLMELQINKATSKEYSEISTKLIALLTQYGISPYTLDLQVLKAHFDAFYLKNFDAAKEILTQSLALPLNMYQKSQVKMELADILLLDQKFNQAIIYYAQIEDDLKNDEIAHEASYKMAKASYFKGDFEWAQNQFKVLKSSTSQLISNDSMELFLLINDNTVEDSTQVALKKFSKADFLAYQNKNSDALAEFKNILLQHKGESIEDETLLKIGQLYQKESNFQEALANFKLIIDNHSEGIYMDEALFFSAEIYRKTLADVEKAKAHYEKLIFNHEDSIYFVEARNNFRKLRGDTSL